MITIQTVTSKIQDADGSFPSGQIIIESCDQFEFTQAGVRRKVSKGLIQVPFTSGLLDASFQIAPTKNASQDKDNLFYTATWYFDDGARKIEFWEIDGAGAATLEITSIPQVIPSLTAGTEDFIPSDDVSIASIAGGIPRAGSDGTISAEWITGVAGAVFVTRYIVTAYSDLIAINPGSTIARGYVSEDDDAYVWAGGRWRRTG